jgi:hypothetical protein
MTIEVYRINPQTGARTQVSRKRTVKPADAPEFSSEYPPCACPRCSGSAQGANRLRAQVAEANRRSRGAL